MLVSTRIVHAREKIQNAPSTKVQIAEGGWSVGKTNYIVKTSSATYDFCFLLIKMFPSLVCQLKNLKGPRPFCWVLWFPPLYSDYSFSFWTALGIWLLGLCVFIFC